MTLIDIKALQAMPTRALMAKALTVKLQQRGRKFSLCSIINAKSGKCSEDCKFCTQSAHYQTNTPAYPLKSVQEITTAAKKARNDGASHFSIVTSGKGISKTDLPRLTEIISAIRTEVDINVCASLGIGNTSAFNELKQSGLSRYHHNLESSKEFFPHLVTTHSFAEREETIRAAQKAGLEVCAGGIIGLGESEEDRISMALSLKELQVDSVPLNILIPLPGTPLETIKPIDINEILRAVSLFRLILPHVPLRLAAGRDTLLADFLSSVFMAGADGMMIGGYLTQRGRSVETDQEFVEKIIKLWE